jgi:Leucine-rich repeat (LRR) protein
LKFLDKAQINFDNLDIKMVCYKEKLIGVILDSKLILKNKMIEDIEAIKGLDENSDIIEELDLAHNKITKIKGFDNLLKLKKLNLKDNYIEKIEGLDDLKNLEFLDLSGNVNITEIPDNLCNLSKLKTLKLTGCRIKKFSKTLSHFFWMGQNFRNYSGYKQEDVLYYEKTHSSRASNNGRLYKNFVKWLFKLKWIMKKFQFDYEDIAKFEKETEISALFSGRPTKAFLKYLSDRYQMKITSFL